MNDRRGEVFHAILEAKYARIINQISEVHNISVEDAMGIFYNSPMLPLLEEGASPICIAVATSIWPKRFGRIIKVRNMLLPLHRALILSPPPDYGCDISFPFA